VQTQGLITNMYCGKTADSIEMPFGMVGLISPRNDVLDGVQLLSNLGGIGCPVQRIGDATFSQITLDNLFEFQPYCYNSGGKSKTKFSLCQVSVEIFDDRNISTKCRLSVDCIAQHIFSLVTILVSIHSSLIVTWYTIPSGFVFK